MRQQRRNPVLGAAGRTRRLPTWFAPVLVLSTASAWGQVWDQVPLIEHSDYQAVNPDGSSAYSGTIPFRMRGVVLNDSEDWLDATENYNVTPWNLGGEAEVFVQAVDLDGTAWDPDPANPFDDFGGTAAWMGQCYGNLPFVGDPGFSNIDVAMAGQPGETRPVWYDELDRLGFNRPDTPLTNDQIIRAGDLVELRARENGLVYAGKHNVNEQHNNRPQYNYEVVILEKDFGLPDPARIRLSDVKDEQDGAIFDATRQTGGERYQAQRVRIERVRLTDTADWGTDSDLSLEDDTGRTLGVHLGLNASFDDSTAPWGYFHAIGIMDQAASHPTLSTDGYRLLAMSAADFVFMEGDVEEDWDVDNTDLGVATGNFTGPVPSGKTWAEGDFDDDGDVDNTDLGQAFGNFTGPVLRPLGAEQSVRTLIFPNEEPPGGAPNRADLIYDPLSGQVFLDQTEAAGAVITNFVLGNNEGGLITGVVNWPFLGALKTDLTFEISQTDPLSTGLPTDVWNLGAVFPAGMNQQELEGFLDQATYVGQLGSGMFDLDLTVVPEPGALALLATALIACGACRLLRRRGKTG